MAKNLTFEVCYRPPRQNATHLKNKELRFSFSAPPTNNILIFYRFPRNTYFMIKLIKQVNKIKITLASSFLTNIIFASK